MTKIFLTGATGYIGGEALQLLSKTHPEYSIRALVRDASKGSAVTSVFPNVQIVQGDLDDTDTLTREAAEADIVLHLAATGHLKSVQAIHQGILSSPKKEKPTTWIQISGASLLAAPELASSSRVPGSPSEDIFDDLDGVAKVRDLIKAHPARAVDNYILDVASSSAPVRTALVIPPIIYGPGRGPVKTRSVQIDELAKVTLQRKKGLQVGQGLSRWGNVHAQDLSQLLLLLVDKAAQGGSEDDLWNLDGIYLAGLGEKTFAEISKRVASEAAKKGFIPTDEVDELLQGDIDVLPHATVLYGTNARSHSRRGKERLGWAPTREDGLDADISRAVDAEAKALGLVPAKV